MRITGKRRKKRIKLEDKYRKACWYLSRGYPAKFIAWKVGAHYKTVEAWSRKAGTDSRTVYRLVSRVNRLEPHLRAKLVERLVAA